MASTLKHLSQIPQRSGFLGFLFCTMHWTGQVFYGLSGNSHNHGKEKAPGDAQAWPPPPPRGVKSPQRDAQVQRHGVQGRGQPVSCA